MVVLPPGVILQLLYLEERLAGLAPGRFMEIGPGRGEISRLLLDRGWSGVAYELEEQTAIGLARRFSREISEGRYAVAREDWLESTLESKFDLVISCMVIEHLDESGELDFMRQAARTLDAGGKIIGLVPASPSAWGIEDDIAGHFRRYTSHSLAALMDKSGWTLSHMAGLTFPVSNVLLPVSNWLVNRQELANLKLSATERTKLSGHRHVVAKTHFPPLFGLLLNPYVLRPFHWLQKRFLHSDRALVLYFEAQFRS